MLTDEELVAKTINNAGWTCSGGTHEPGNYDDCAECRDEANRVARAVLEALTTAGRLIPEGAEVGYAQAVEQADGSMCVTRFLRSPGDLGEGYVLMSRPLVPWREVQGDE